MIAKTILDEGRSKKKGKANSIDVEVGNQLKQRRLFLGLSQEDLAKKVDLTFQQIQKYESGTNRISASRLYEFSQILDFPVNFFFLTWEAKKGKKPPKTEDRSTIFQQSDLMNRKETYELLNVFYGLKDPKLRRDFFKLFKSLQNNLEKLSL